MLMTTCSWCVASKGNDLYSNSEMLGKIQSPPKQTNLNHFVAQFTSRPWLLDTNQFYKLSVDKTGVRAKPTGPRSWGGEEKLYSQEVENAFQTIESKLALLQRHLESGAAPSEDERYGWAMWLLSSYLRTPSALLCSAEVGECTQGFTGDFFRTSYALLASCVTNPHCLELIANRDWQILVSEKPYFLKPDTGLVLTDRLDSDDCQILYPLTPFSCFLATGNKRGFSKSFVQRERVFELNNHILLWSDSSVACSPTLWKDEEILLRNAVQTHLAAGKYYPPTSGRFFSLTTVKVDGKTTTTILSPKGPILMTVKDSAIRPAVKTGRPTIPGLYDVEDSPDITLGVRFSGNEDEIDYVSSASFMMHVGQKELALTFARKALLKDAKNQTSKLIVMTCDITADFGELIPEGPDDAAELAFWWALERKDPLEGLKIASTWLSKYRDHERLAQANFYCAFTTYGAKLFQLFSGSVDHLPYINDNTPLPNGAIEFVNRVFSHSGSKLVSHVQRHIGKIDINASGIPADILRLCGLSNKLRPYLKI